MVAPLAGPIRFRQCDAGSWCRPAEEDTRPDDDDTTAAIRSTPPRLVRGEPVSPDAVWWGAAVNIAQIVPGLRFLWYGAGDHVRFVRLFKETWRAVPAAARRTLARYWRSGPGLD